MTPLARIAWEGSTIRMFREWLRESRTGFGRLVGAGYQAVRLWETGGRTPGPRSLKALDALAEREGWTP